MENLQTRTEHSRSIEDAEQYRSIDTLKELGLFVPVSELETFHGRVGNAQDQSEWAVDPSFANGSNDSGNNNVYSRPTLYTSEEGVANDFINRRAAEIIRPQYDKFFMQKVRDYTPEQRKAWLSRLNSTEQDWWDSLPKDQRSRYSQSGPRLRALDDLDSSSEIYRESRYLEDTMPQEQKSDLWGSISDKYRGELHEIAVADTDAVVLDLNFDISKLDEEQTERYRRALEVLAIPVTEGSPVGFEDRSSVGPFIKAINQLKKYYISRDGVAEVAAIAGIGDQVALQLVGAFNARQISRLDPKYLIHKLAGQATDIFVDEVTINGEKTEVPVNLEYVQRYMRLNHIVGVKELLRSATLGKNITSISFFDLDKTTTTEHLEASRTETLEKLGELASGLNQLPQIEGNPDSKLLLRLFSDVHVKPQKLVEAAKEVDGYRAIFQGDTGTWEGFTLAEHTEAVLRNFDENYADKLPVEMLTPMRLAILAHDVGKPLASASGEKHKQKQYNIAQADDFLSRVGVDDRLKDLLLAVIGDGEDLAFQIAIRGAGESTQVKMREFAVKTLSKFYGSDNITDNQISSFVEMCNILQVCDGGAYTSMAITRTKQGRYRNAPSFNGSFSQPLGFGKRGLKLRKPGETPAADNLTPRK